jgi:transposase InsO family protein
MAWKEMSVIDQREEFVRLASLEGANRRELCRRFGISAQTGYKWLGRMSSGEGLEDRSRRPSSSPSRTAEDMEKKVKAVRAEHPAWGARKIHSVLEGKGLAVPAVSTVHQVLKRHDLILPKKGGEAAHLRFERQEPNQLWQMDFKGSSALGNGGRLHPLTVIDDHSRYCPCLMACAEESQETVKTHLERAFRLHGLPQAFFVDNGSPWGDPQGGKWTSFKVWLMKLGILLIHARMFHPQSRGKNERFHRSMDDEIFAMRPLGDLKDAQRAFDRWRDIYNHKRPHEGIGMKRPADRYRPSPRPMPDKLPEIEYGQGETVRKVSLTKPELSFKGKSVFVSRAFLGERLAIRPHDVDGTYGIYFGANLIKTIDLGA